MEGVDERYKNNTEKFIVDGLLNQPNLYTQDYLSQTILCIHYRILFLSVFSLRLYIRPLTVLFYYFFVFAICPTFTNPFSALIDI